MIGQTLGHYRIVEKVAAGGMGVVYRARDEQLDRDVALKVLPSGTLSDDASRKHFRKEAMALARLNHPNIETVYEFGTQDGMDFLVMEYVPGKTLAERLKGGTLPEKEVIALGMQIAAALEEAHERGIVHRDLKPANIAITQKGRAKILDFGLAKLLRPVEEGTTEAFTDSQAAAGTLPYMPPEQLTGGPVDARADIYTIGAVLYEMATDRRAFQEEQTSRLIDAILHQPPVAPRARNPRISPELENIILKCLDKDPDRRYQSATELLVDLRRLAQPSSSYAPRDAPSLTGGRVAKLIGYTVAGLLVLAVGLTAMNAGGWRDRLLGRVHTPPIRSLAVLPFENLTGDTEQDYFADGMTEALITDLGQIQALRVISRTSVMKYKAARKPLADIARELHVDAIIEGSVSHSQNLAQVTARMFYGPTETLLWSKSYQRDLQNVLIMQGEVASAIVREIDVTLTPQERARLASGRPVNPAAHDAYLKGRYHLHRGTEDQMREAKTYFEEAIRIDSNYAPAYAGLADYYWLTNELSPRVAMPTAKDYVQKALALDDGLADAHATLATIKFYGDWDWLGADREYRRAIELSPSYAAAHRVYSGFLSEMGRHDQALAEIRTAQELEPDSAITNLSAGWAFYYAREYDRAIEQCRTVLDSDPHSMSARDCVGSAQLASGANDQAIELYRTIAASSGNDPLRLASLGFAYALSGRKADARKVIAQLNDASKVHYVPASLLAEIHAALGDRDKAFSWLEKAYEEHDSFLVRLKVEPALDPLRSDKRFGELLHRMSL
jgi:serine/threonine protein kinase/Tfp pilus assembly protein PilF